MNKENIPYEKQIFVCTNNPGDDKPCCGKHQGEDIFKELRRIAKERNLHPRIRVAQAKCLGKCSMGTNIMIYPDNIWFSRVSMDQISELADQFLPQNPSIQ